MNARFHFFFQLESENVIGIWMVTYWELL